jgi:ubiquinone/menaquinone biosynthesis C-methylase UbiE
VRSLRPIICAALLLPVLLCLAQTGDRDSWNQTDRVMVDLNLRPGWAVADIGCGEGYLTFRLAKAVGDAGRVFAEDISEGCLAAVRQQAEQQHFANVQTVLGGPTDVRLAPGSLDAALFCDVLHEVPAAQRQALVASVCRAIKPSGFLFIIDYRKSHEITCDPYEILVPHDDLVGFATNCGLSMDAEFHYLHWQVFLRFLKPAEPRG